MKFLLTSSNTTSPYCYRPWIYGMKLVVVFAVAMVLVWIICLLIHAMKPPIGKRSLCKHQNQKKTTHLQRKDAFLSHDWGRFFVDGQEERNHPRVARISKGLEAKKLECWIDEEEMHGILQDRMCEGIDNSTVFLVHITQNYVDKVCEASMMDNCKKEFFVL